MRALEPVTQGFVQQGGVRVGYEVFGEGEPAVLLLPTWRIVHSRLWKAQVPYLARRGKVITFDPRGNGRSDRPTAPDAYTDAAYVGDAFAVLDACGVKRAVVVGYCTGARWGIEMADVAPERVSGLVAIAAGFPGLAPRPTASAEVVAMMDPEFWRRDYAAFVEQHSGAIFMTPEPFSSRVREELTAWGMETTPDVLLAGMGLKPAPPGPTSAEEAQAMVRRLRCPLLAIAGTEDVCQGVAISTRLAELTGGQLLVLEGAGHAMLARHPVQVNLAIAGFVEQVVAASRSSDPDHVPEDRSPVVTAAPRVTAEAPPPAAPPTRYWSRSLTRPRKALYLSSPIGLGHARRDLAIARALRAQRPGLQIEWLTQHPVTEFLEGYGESIHPASEQLANESRHIETEAGEFELNVFEAIHRMDEVLVANFMVFHDLLKEESFDVVIGDEAWDVDHFLFENPELKRCPYVWMADFCGWLPLTEGGDREAELTADYNAEMIAHVERFPWLRDRAIFIGDPGDVISGRFGPGLPRIRPWVEANYEFAGYVSGYEPSSLESRPQLRAELGYGPDDLVCLVTVGGSGVGRGLLDRVIEAFPLAKAAVPALRMVVVTGPRIAVDGFPRADGLEVRGYVHDLHRHLAAGDMAVVQGGLSTTMELTAARTPFVYVPIPRHFEQNLHVRHRLRRYRAGRCIEYPDATPAALADAIAGMIGRPVSYRKLDGGGAERAARMIAELI